MLPLCPAPHPPQVRPCHQVSSSQEQKACCGVEVTAELGQESLVTSLSQQRGPGVEGAGGPPGGASPATATARPRASSHPLDGTGAARVTKTPANPRVRVPRTHSSHALCAVCIRPRASQEPPRGGTHPGEHCGPPLPKAQGHTTSTLVRDKVCRPPPRTGQLGSWRASSLLG